MTLQQAKAKLSEYGMTIRKRDGEYRVTYSALLAILMGYSPHDCEAVAYYTNDIDDAVATGLAIVARQRG